MRHGRAGPCCPGLAFMAPGVLKPVLTRRALRKFLPGMPRPATVLSGWKPAHPKETQHKGTRYKRRRYQDSAGSGFGNQLRGVFRG